MLKRFIDLRKVVQMDKEYLQWRAYGIIPRFFWTIPRAWLAARILPSVVLKYNVDDGPTNLVDESMIISDVFFRRVVELFVSNVICGCHCLKNEIGFYLQMFGDKFRVKEIWKYNDQRRLQ